MLSHNNPNKNDKLTQKKLSIENWSAKASKNGNREKEQKIIKKSLILNLFIFLNFETRYIETIQEIKSRITDQKIISCFDWKNKIKGEILANISTNMNITVSRIIIFLPTRINSDEKSENKKFKR